MVPGQNDNSIKISHRESGYSTGDVVVVDETGYKWLEVSEFSEYRATGERRGILKYGAIFEI